MPQTARAIRIGLIGGECTGKSTLAADLSAALRRCLRDGAGVEPRVVVVGEVLRTFVTEHQRAPQVAEQAGIMAEQRLAEEQAEQIGDIVIADPATMMTAVYSQLYFRDRSLWPQALHQAGDYALLLWCRPDLPWLADPGQRDGPAFRQRADRIIAGSQLARSARQLRGDRRARAEGAVMHAIAMLGATGVWREGEPGFRT